MKRAAFELLGCITLAAVAATATREARADDTKAACVRSYEQAQKLRLAGDPLASRAELRLCSRAACPALLHVDCQTWLREVEPEIPSVVVSVRTPAGVDRTDVSVSVDGELAQERLNGAALEVNPGERRFRFEAPGAAPVEQTVLINTGEKNRLLSVILGERELAAPGLRPGPVGPRPGPMAPIPAAPGPDAPAAPGPPLVPIALGAVGLVAAGAGIALDLVGSAELRGLRSTCAPLCDEADVDATRATLIAGDALLGVGIVSLGAAAFLWLTRDEPRAAPAKGASRAALPAPFTVVF
ncbi:hypothetical protein WMF31_15180 [Sorangium sp. So ce1036]|uniref:hypothetical protein n=1 Tax=Sorangium sp. So ce1036 TaxID=3133328 RepID=UPI003F110851